jgi:hypothetical protein
MERGMLDVRLTMPLLSSAPLRTVEPHGRTRQQLLARPINQAHSVYHVGRTKRDGACSDTVASLESACSASAFAKHRTEA